MKKLLLAIAIFSALSVNAQTPQGQSFNLDTKKAPKTEEQLLKNSQPTTNTAIYHNTTHKVYSTEKGKLFIVTTSKAGNLYRKYIGN